VWFSHILWWRVHIYFYHLDWGHCVFSAVGTHLVPKYQMKIFFLTDHLIYVGVTLQSCKKLNLFCIGIFPKTEDCYGRLCCMQGQLMFGQMQYILGLRQRSWYSDLLRAGRSGNQIPVGMRFSIPIQTSPKAHPASCTMGTGSVSRG
jgi:hypothetical protein